MKSIELLSATETVSVGGASREQQLSTVALLKIALNNPPEGGYTPSEMLSRIKVIDKVEAIEKSEAVPAITTLELEDAEFATTKACVAAVKWGFISRFILEFTQLFK